jgi:hypothetical protein
MTNEKSETQSFIKDAIAGGWKEQPTSEMPKPHLDTEHEDYPRVAFYYDEYPEEGAVIYAIHEILLDPLAWQAVGKTRGWKLQATYWKWHIFVDHLIDGKSVEEALQAIR